MKALIDTYPDNEFIQIVKSSFSYAEVARKLGYKSNSGDLTDRIKQRINYLKISISHFTFTTNKTERNEDNIFCENSTANQTTLRRWYIKGNYSEYKCSICGLLPIWNNKKLTLILDHINGNNKDDRLENLRWVCPNCNQQLPTTNGKNKKINKKVNYCIDCGREISANAKRCIECNNKTQIREDKPTREELKTMIRNIPFTKIGKKYEVSDNAIRKWCVSYNLPRKKSDINKYTDEEWEKI